MAYFTRPVESVSETKIFARGTPNGRQVLVYQAIVNAPAPVALLLPLPVRQNLMVEDVRFFDLEAYPAIFVDLGMSFPSPPIPPRPPGTKGPIPQKNYRDIKLAEVQTSFVPTATALLQLDDEFRPTVEFWKKHPQYAKSGFVVFKVPAGEHRLSPVAFDFPRRNPDELYFPTWTMMGNDLPDSIGAETSLITQPTEGYAGKAEGWVESRRPAGFYVRIAKLAPGLLIPEAHLYQKQLTTKDLNKDVILEKF